MTQVTLIKPPTVVNMDSLSYHNSIPPLGLAYVSAVTKAAGHQVAVIDAPGEDIDTYHPLRHRAVEGLYTHGLSLPEIVERVPRESRVIGITNMYTHEWPLLEQLIRMLKAELPEATMVLGGESASTLWWHMMERCPELDCCVIGEGERTFEELLAAVDQGSGFSTIASLAYRDDTGRPARSTATRKRIHDINVLPWPDWEAFPVEAYLARSYSSGVKRGRSLPMLCSRGCPFQCTFCSSPGMWSTRYVSRKPELVVDEIEHWVDRYGVTNVDFQDLTSMVSKKWILGFCDAILERGIDITWQIPTGTRCEALDAECLAALHRSGCRNLSYSAESGSRRILKKIRKDVDLPALMRSARTAVDQGIITNVNFMLGLPGETYADVWQTYKLIVRLAFDGIHSAGLMVFNPYPGSALFAELLEQGKLELNDDFYFGPLLRGGKTSISFNAAMPPRALVAVQLGIISTFFGLQYATHPRRALESLGKLFTGGEQETTMDQFLATRWLYWRKRREADRRSRAHGRATTRKASAGLTRDSLLLRVQGREALRTVDEPVVGHPDLEHDLRGRGARDLSN